MPSTSLRIATLVKALPVHRSGGMENHAWDLARGLAARDHRVTVVTSAHPRGERETSCDGVRVIHLPKGLAGQNSWAFFTAVSHWVSTFDGEFDLFHAQGFAALRANPEKSPLISTVHGTVWSETPLARQVRERLSFTQKLKVLWRFKARTVMGPLVHAQWLRSKRLICDSDFTRREIEAKWPKWSHKIDVVPLGIDLPAEVPTRDDNLSERPIRLLSVGRLELVKGLDDLLVALSLPETPRRFHLTIVGDGPHRRALERQVRRLPLGDCVSIRGRIDGAALAEEWNRADLFVNPEWSQPAFGLVSLEALGRGLPVLGTQTGATPEIVTPEVGTLLTWGVPQRLAAELKRLADDPSVILAQRAAARARAEEFTREAMVEGTERAFFRALS